MKNHPNIFLKGIKVSSRIILFFISISLFTSCDTVEPNERGVLFKRYQGGLQKDKIYHPGLHLFTPGDWLITYDITVQEYKEQITVLSKNGLSYTFDITLSYHVVENRIGYLHEMIGKDYLRIVIRPEVRSAVRTIVGEYTSDEIPSIEYATWEREFLEKAQPRIEEKYIVLDSIVIKDIMK